MRFHYSASALALITSAVLAQDCPSGFHRGTIEWYDCPVDAIKTLQCATLDVPLDYQQPAGKVLELRLVRLPASVNPRNKTVIYNPGGPGVAGIGNFIGGGLGLDIQKLTGLGYNVLTFDPRGTGFTIPFQCKSTSTGTDFKSTDSDLIALQSALQQQADTCADPDDKADNMLMGTAYVANDIKSIAAALGEDGLIRYFGYSYGTLLGSTTAAMFPDYIDRMYLDGNINPKDYYYGLGAEAVADLDNSVARFFELCATAGPRYCALAVAGQTGIQLQQTFDNFLSNITSYQSYNIRKRFFDNLYSPSTFTNWSVQLKAYYANPARVPKTKRQAEPEGEGDWDPTESEDSILGLYGVTCADWKIRPAGTLANFKSWLSLYTSTSKYGGDQAVLTTTYQCALWETDALEKPQSMFTNVKTKTPILFGNGQYDPVTPLISAQNSSSGFIGSQLLVTTGFGHCTNKQPSKALDAAIMQYFDDASFPTVQQIYTPDSPNPFTYDLSAETNTTQPASNSTVKRTARRAFNIPVFKKTKKNIISKRLTTIPIGCVAGNSTGSTPYSAKPATPYSNSTKTGASYATGAGYPNSPYQTAKVSVYSIGNNGYNTYLGSKPSAVPCPSGYKPVTSVVTTTVCNTVTACPYGGNCQIGQVVTKTVTKTSINYVATIPGVPATIKYTPASAPGQGYSVAKTTTKSKSSKASASAPVYGSNANPSSPAAPVYPASNPSSPAAPVYPAGTPAAPAAPGYSAAKTPAAASAYSAKNAATGTPVSGYPAQFTGAASSDRAALSFVGFFAAFALFAFNL